MKALILAGIVALIASGNKWDLWIIVAIIVTGLYQLVRHFLLKYRITDDELVIREGLIFRSERNIPIERIHNVDLVQGIVARRLDLAEARVQTAGGGEAEAVLKVLSLGDIDRIRARIAHGRHQDQESASGSTGGATVGDDSGVLLRLGLPDLVRLGLITNRGILIVGVVMGLMWQFDLFDRIPEPDELIGQIAVGWLGGVAIALTAFVMLAVFSVGWAILRFYGFELRRVGDDFRLSAGLLTTRSATIPRGRVQLVSVRTSPLHKLFGRVSVRVETGGGTEDEESTHGRVWFVPIVREEQSDVILRELGYPGLAEIEWQRLAPGAMRRATKRGVITGLIVFVGLFWIPWPWGLVIGASAFVLVLIHTRAEVRRMRWTGENGFVGVREGVFFVATSLSKRRLAQVVSISESPFDRRRGMVKIAVDTAGGGPAGRRIRIPYLMRETAGDLERSLV